MFLIFREILGLTKEVITVKLFSPCHHFKVNRISILSCLPYFFQHSFIIAPPRCISCGRPWVACMSRRDQHGTFFVFLGKRKRAIASPPTSSFTPPSSEGLYGTYFLVLTPHYSKLTICPQAFVIPVLPKTESINSTYFINKWACWRQVFMKKGILMVTFRPN